MMTGGFVRDGVPSVAGAEHARHVVEIIEAGYRSAETGQAQALATPLSRCLWISVDLRRGIGSANPAGPVSQAGPAACLPRSAQPICQTLCSRRTWPLSRNGGRRRNSHGLHVVFHCGWGAAARRWQVVGELFRGVAARRVRVAFRISSGSCTPWASRCRRSPPARRGRRRPRAGPPPGTAAP